MHCVEHVYFTSGISFIPNFPNTEKPTYFVTNDGMGKF